MKLKFKDTPISTLSEWEALVFSGSKKKHWQPGRSAYSLADFVINRNGITLINSLVASAVGEEINFEIARPEFEARFDSYSHGREHDLAIWGTSKSGKKVFVGIESKVDESFNKTIGSAYLSAKARELNGENTNAPRRIEELLKLNFSDIKESDFTHRYQLLFTTAGTLCIDADIHVLIVLVFKTDKYDNIKGAQNQTDLRKFLQRINAEEIESNVFKATISGRELCIIYEEVETHTSTVRL